MSNTRACIQGGVGSETNFLVDEQVEELKFELEEERAISRVAQENWEAQLRVNRELEKEIEQLKQQAASQVRFLPRQGNDSRRCVRSFRPTPDVGHMP